MQIHDQTNVLITGKTSEYIPHSVRPIIFSNISRSVGPQFLEAMTLRHEDLLEHRSRTKEQLVT